MEGLLSEIVKMGRNSFGEDKQFSFQHVRCVILGTSSRRHLEMWF